MFLLYDIPDSCEGVWSARYDISYPHVDGCVLGYGVGGWKFKKVLKVFDTGQFLCKNEF